MASKAPKRAVEEEGVVYCNDFDSEDEEEEEEVLEDHTTSSPGRDIVPRSQGMASKAPKRAVEGEGVVYCNDFDSEDEEVLEEESSPSRDIVLASPQGLVVQQQQRREALAHLISSLNDEQVEELILTAEDMIKRQAAEDADTGKSDADDQKLSGKHKRQAPVDDVHEEDSRPPKRKAVASPTGPLLFIMSCLGMKRWW